MPKTTMLDEEKRKPRTTWLLSSEYEQLKQEAKAMNLSFSDYSRAILLERPVVEPRGEIDRRTYAELGRIGNNLNQLVRGVNEGRLIGEQMEVDLFRATVTELSNLLVEIRLELAL